MYSASFLTALGQITVYFSSRGICRLVLPGMAVDTVDGFFDNGNKDGCPDYLHELRECLSAHIEGIPVMYDFPIDLSGASAFRRKVWRSVKDIPYGKVRSYGWVANKIGNSKAARAVGQALAGNPVPLIIPCHRVINSNGKSGGFAGKISNIETKLKLLSIEGYTFG